MDRSLSLFIFRSELIKLFTRLFRLLEKQDLITSLKIPLSTGSFSVRLVSLIIELETAGAGKKFPGQYPSR